MFHVWNQCLKYNKHRWTRFKNVFSFRLFPSAAGYRFVFVSSFCPGQKVRFVFFSSLKRFFEKKRFFVFFPSFWGLAKKPVSSFFHLFFIFSFFLVAAERIGHSVGQSCTLSFPLPHWLDGRDLEQKSQNYNSCSYLHLLCKNHVDFKGSNNSEFCIRHLLSNVVWNHSIAIEVKIAQYCRCLYGC